MSERTWLTGQGANVSFDYRDRVAVVTGASTGIGRRLSLDLAERGTTVVAVARRADLLEEVAGACRRSASRSAAVVADVGDRTAVEGVISGALERLGRIDLLVNNAAVPMRIHAARLTPEQVEHTMRVNFLGAAYATLAVLPAMREEGHGHIVNVASVAARMGSPREAAYTASKFAMAGWSEVLAADLAGSGVHVQLVIPGPIDTEIWDKAGEPPAYKGKLFPPSIVSAAVLRSIERDTFERWAPRRLRAIGLFHALARERFIKGLARYDRRASARRGTRPGA